MAIENPDTFNQRLSQWVANQGFWFQVRYSMASGGSRGVVLGHLLRFLIRLSVLVAVVAIAGAIYLVRLPGTEGFAERVETSINDGLGAVESKMSGFQRVQGEMMIRRFASEGGNKSFFSVMEAKNIKARMGFFDVLPGKWSLGVLTVGELDLHLNAGADDAEGAKRISEIVFQDFGDLEFEMIDVSNGTIRWGFSERSRGMIVGSHIRFHRVSHGWRMQATGGQFSQGWLRRLEIVELSANCSPAGVVFDKAEFRKGSGVLRMDGLKVEAGERPQVNGVVRMNRLPLEDLIPEATQEFMEGMISGEFKVSGSTNSDEGLLMDGVVTVDEFNPIRLRDRIYLLRALSEFSVYSNFKTVEFNQGSFRMMTKSGEMELTEVDLKAGEMMTLAGQMKVRMPTREEAAAAIQRNRAGAPVADSRVVADPAKSREENETNVSLRRAALEAKRDRERKAGDGADDAGEAFFARIGQTFEARMFAEQAVERESRTLVYEGLFQLTVPAETFANTPVLREAFPVDPQTGRIPLDVPLMGDLYSLTFDQTEDLYLRGKKY